MNVEISGPHRLTTEDRPRLWHLTRRVGHMRSLFDDPGNVIYVEARIGLGETAGWAAAWPLKSGEVEVGVFVANEHRRHGIGRLLAVAINHAARRRWRGLKVIAIPISPSGRHMYKAAGFKHDAVEGDWR